MKKFYVAPSIQMVLFESSNIIANSLVDDIPVGGEGELDKPAIDCPWVDEEDTF